MAKGTKESTTETTESSNLAVDGGSVGSADVAKLVKQRLESLHRAGITHLPTGTGEFQFDLSQIAPETEEVAQPEQLQASGSQGGSAKQVDPAPAGSAVRETKTDLTSPAAKSPAAQAKPTTSQPQSQSKDQANIVDSSPYGQTLALSQRQNALQVLQNEVADCTQCEQLASTRTQTVFGVGNPEARLVFLGEGPGANEDRLGEPFVGEAGQLLDKILGACGLSRTDVYILNTVKCRPPANRNPAQDELANCWGFAERQLEILQPEFICCLGSVASRTLLKTNLSIGKLRKRFHSYRSSQVLVTYHPAYLLRTPSAKKHVWEDMKLLMKEMGIELSK